MEPGFIESAYVVSPTVTSVPAPRQSARPDGCADADVLRWVPRGQLRPDPADTGNTAQNNFDIELYKDGTTSSHRVFVDTHGVRQGRSVPFAITLSGTYHSRTSANNLNGKGAWGPFSTGLEVTISSRATVSEPRPSILIGGDDVQVIVEDP